MEEKDKPLSIMAACVLSYIAEFGNIGIDELFHAWTDIIKKNNDPEFLKKYKYQYITEEQFNSYKRELQEAFDELVKRDLIIKNDNTYCLAFYKKDRK